MTGPRLAAPVATARNEFSQALPSQAPPPQAAVGRPAEPMSVELRRRTRDAHVMVERSFALDAWLKDRTTYASLLVVLRAFYRPVEAALGELEGWGRLTPPLDVGARRRAGLLDDDLDRLGVEIPAPESGTGSAPELGEWLGALGSLSRGLGCLYVLEGSALGGQIVARRARTAIDRGLPVSFFAAADRSDLHGDWHALKAAADGYRLEHGPGAGEEMVEAARATFSILGGWLERSRR